MTTEQPHDFQDDSQAAGPGQLLRNAREQLGWTREQVASRIHLRLTLIAAIEADSGARLPGSRRIANRQKAAREGVTFGAALMQEIEAMKG